MASAIQFGTGVSSGIDWSTITDTIIKADSYPITNLQTEITNLKGAKQTFNNLATQLNAFKATLQTLHDSSTLGGKTTTVTGAPSGSIQPFTATSGGGALTGSYSVTVNSLAAAKRVRSDGMADSSSPTVSDGRLTFKSGSNDAITIDVTAASGNNSLESIADTINNANKGVAASIVRDGTNSILIVKSAKTGTDNDLVITDTTNLHLAASGNVLQAAKNATINVDGIDIVSQSNTVSNAIPGIDLTLTAETRSYGAVTLSVADDVAGTKKSLQDLVDGYNKINSIFEAELGSKDAQSTSTVASSSIYRNMRQQLQSMLTDSVTGVATGKVGSLAELGIEVADRTGALKFNGTTFDNLVSQGRFDEVRAVLQSSGSTSDPLASFVSATSSTKAGTYAVQVTTAAEQATLLASNALSASGITAGETLTIGLNGTSTDVSLAAGDKIDAIVTKINAALKDKGLAATAKNDGGKLHILSTEFGSAQSLSVTSSLANPGDGSQTGFGTTAATDTGVDVAGTIGGFAATGTGRDLVGSEGTDVAGLAVRIYADAAVVAGKGGAFGTVGYSAGMTDQFLTQLKGITDPLSGTIQSVTKGLDDSVKIDQDKITRLQDALAAKRELLTKQFAAAEAAVSQLNQMMSSLSAKTTA